MLKPRIIPCLDYRDGRVVKGVRFANLRDVGEPAQLAVAYEAQGADEIVMLDVSATREGRHAGLDALRRVRAELSIPLSVGGGVRCRDDAEEFLAAGADRVCVNTAAVDQPSLIHDLATRFGTQCIVIAIDARRQCDSWEVLTRSGTQAEPLDAIDWAHQAQKLGAGEILLTSFDRDGTRQGFDTDLITAASQRLNIPVIASGGAATVDHMAQALRAGAQAVLAASIFHDNDTTVQSIKAQLAALGLEVRL